MTSISNAGPPGDAGAGAPAEDRLFETLKRLLAFDATTVRGTMEQVSQLVAEVLGAEKVDAFLHESTTDTLVAVGTSDTEMGRLQRAIGLDRQPLANGGRAVEVYRKGGYYLCNDVQADDGELLGLRQGLGIQSTISVPLDVAGRRRGVLSVASDKPGRFTPADVAFMQAVAAWLGVAVHRAELVEELTRSAEQRGRHQAAEEMLTVYAHDIRNHLMTVSLRLQVLAQRASRDGRAQDLADVEKVRDNVRRLGQFAETQLDIGRLKSGLFMLAPEKVDLVALVQETAELVSAADGEVRVEGLRALEVEVDTQALRQALENLLANARKFSPPGAPVVIRVEAADERFACIRVRDFGPGVSPELLPRLFDRFVSGASSSGIGLGLYLARGLVEAHGGTLEVEPVEGPGACFCIKLPLHPPLTAG
jgi:signal transduction histidine kinase